MNRNYQFYAHVFQDFQGEATVKNVVKLQNMTMHRQLQLYMTTVELGSMPWKHCTVVNLGNAIMYFIWSPQVYEH